VEGEGCALAVHLALVGAATTRAISRRERLHTRKRALSYLSWRGWDGVEGTCHWRHDSEVIEAQPAKNLDVLRRSVEKCVCVECFRPTQLVASSREVIADAFAKIRRRNKGLSFCFVAKLHPQVLLSTSTTASKDEC